MRRKSKQRIGIYAGAFDPVHNGHITFAKEALTKAGLDKVFLLVEPRPRRKQGVKAFAHRTAMVEAAIADEPNLGQIMLDQARFTVHETWPILLQRFEGAQLFMLMGEDVFVRLAHWPRIDELVTSAHFIVGLRNREEQEVRAHFKMVGNIKALELHYDIFRADENQHTSRTIRTALREGRIPDGLHPSVVRYIEEHQLYASDLRA